MPWKYIAHCKFMLFNALTNDNKGDFVVKCYGLISFLSELFLYLLPAQEKKFIHACRKKLFSLQGV